MKLVDNNGNFQFVKNGQVVIDKTLDKYKQIKKYEDKPNDLDDAIKAASSELSSPNEIVKSSDIVDNALRIMISNMDESNLKGYLMAENAKEFNKLFSNILLGEVKNNSYSVSVYDGNWDLYCVDGEYPNKKKTFKFKSIKRIFSYIRDLIKNKKKNLEETHNALHVLDFFDLIHVEGGKEKDFIDKITGYFKLINNAILMHQDAQLDTLCQNIIINIYESVLAVHGYNKYINFSDITKIKSPGKKVVDIDYIKNFNRVIPQDVVEKKIQCDNMNVFDNYCIMYYDPSGETYAKESQAKRDPILFGLINHSEKLYYIADWEDEYCDLTLDKVAELCNVQEIK